MHKYAKEYIKLYTYHPTILLFFKTIGYKI